MCGNMGSGGSSESGVSQTISNALGKKGKSIPMETAIETVNPNYGKGQEWSHNCQRCIYAYEMQRRGYDVEALPRILKGTDNAANNWAHIMENQTWEHVGRTQNQVKNGLLDKMAGYGDGARAAIYVSWKGRRGAHVFIAEQQNGGTVFLDAQTHKYVDISYYLSRSSPAKTTISRLDNLKPTDLIAECVKRRDK